MSDSPQSPARPAAAGVDADRTPDERVGPGGQGAAGAAGPGGFGKADPGVSGVADPDTPGTTVPGASGMGGPGASGMTNPGASGTTPASNPVSAGRGRASRATERPAAAPVPVRSKVEPAGLMIGVGGVVLLLALWWLWATPRADRVVEGDSARLATIEQRLAGLDALREQTANLGATVGARLPALAALEGRVQQLGALEGRAKALEDRPPPPDIRPLEAQTTALAERVATAERGAGQAADRAAANERRLQVLEARPAFDPATVAPRDALDALSTRLERLSERIEAQAARGQVIEADQTRRLQDLARSQDERRAAAEQAAAQRIAALEASLKQQVSGLDTALGQRIAAVEQAQQKLAALEGRTARLAALDGLQSALAAGQPLGVSLARIEQPPPALTRYGDSAPPTEASLRLSFEDAARVARAASDAAMQPDGSRQGVVDSALARLGGLVTVRRGDQVVWGDAAEAEISRARRALEAGDLDLTLSHVDKLPPPARDAMRGWTDQVRALLAARAALRQLAAG